LTRVGPVSSFSFYSKYFPNIFNYSNVENIKPNPPEAQKSRNLT
jgi:hypothetical protein